MLAVSRRFALRLALACAPVLVGCAALSGAEADLVLKNGNIVTLDQEQPHVRAVAIRDGRIVAMGFESAVNQLIGPQTKVVDLFCGSASTIDCLRMNNVVMNRESERRETRPVVLEDPRQEINVRPAVDLADEIRLKFCDQPELEFVGRGIDPNATWLSSQ